MRNRAIEICKLLNQYVGDLVAATRALELFESQRHFPSLNNENRLSLRRMCISYLIITMSKLAEIYEQYKTIIPQNEALIIKTLYKEIQKRGIVDFRNSVVGHIWDKKNKRLLLSSEIEDLLKKIFGGSMRSFIQWLNNPKDNIYPKTVVSICEHLRNQIIDKYQIHKEEIVT